MTKHAPHHLSLAHRIEYRSVIDANGCWIWQGFVDPKGGYGRLTFQKKAMIAHRASYESHVGPIPEGLHLDHLCRVRRCVNPEHLEPVSPLENVRRSPIHHGAKDCCPYGHRYDEQNTLRYGPRRHCRTCRDINNGIRPYDVGLAEAARLASVPDGFVPRRHRKAA